MIIMVKIKERPGGASRSRLRPDSFHSKFGLTGGQSYSSMSNYWMTNYMNPNFPVNENEREALGLVTKLTRSLDAVERRTLNHLPEIGLTVSQFGVLEALYHLGPMCQRDVAGKVLKSSGNITTVIDNLEKRRLVERIRSAEDRRYIQVHITAEGAGLIEQFFPDHMQRLVQCFSVLTAEERQELSRLTKKLGLSQP